jgi:hypothetical protein
VTSKGFIDGVIHDFKHHVMQTGAIVSIANVHAWAFTYGI